MTKEFTPEFIRQNKGCYNLEQVDKLSFITKPLITIEDILNSEISIKDKRWFLWNKGDLTLDQKKRLSLTLAKVVAPIYNEKYPNDNRINEVLEAAELFLDGKITIEELSKKRAAAADAAAYAADAAADAADAAADAADAAYAAAYAADAAADAADAAYAAAYAAEKSKNKSYVQSLQDAMIEFTKNN